MRTKTPHKTGLIHLRDLLEGKTYKYQDKFYIELNPKFRNEFYQTLLNGGRSITNIANETKIKFTRLWDQLNRTPLSIEILYKLSDYLIKKGYHKYSLEIIEKNILYIKSSGSNSQKVYHPKFPINLLTKEGVRFIAHLYHDGHIGYINKQPGYTNQSKEEIKVFKEKVSSQDRKHVNIHLLRTLNIPKQTGKVDSFVSFNDLGYVKDIPAFVHEVKTILNKKGRFCFYVKHGLINVSPNAIEVDDKVKITKTFKQEKLQVNYSKRKRLFKTEIFIYGRKN